MNRKESSAYHTLPPIFFTIKKIDNGNKMVYMQKKILFASSTDGKTLVPQKMR
jgi:hypothetical protein